MRQIKFFSVIAVFTAFVFFSCSEDPIGPNPPADTTPPKVIATIPPDSSIVNNLMFTAVVVFSEPVVLGEQPVQLSQVSLPKSVPGSWNMSESRDSLFFIPSKPFAPGQMYKMLLTGIRDDAGNIMPDFTFCWFTAEKDTGDTTETDTVPPTVVYSRPAKGAVLVPVNTEIYDRFSEAVDPTTINTQSYKLAKANGDTIAVTVSYDPVTFQASMAHNGLEYETTYRVTLTSAITDTAGNHLVEVVREFTTEADPNPPDITPPTLVNSFPADGATGVSINTAIYDEFSEAMDPTTINTQSYKLAKANGDTIAVTVSYDPVTFQASMAHNGLEYETTYRVTLTSAVTDTAGNHLVEVVREFTTEVDPTPPTPRWVVEDARKVNVIDIDEQGNIFFAADKFVHYYGGFQNDTAVVGKFNQQGILQWIKDLPSSSDLWDQPFGIDYADGFVYVVRTQDPYGNGFGNIYIDKFDAVTGDSVWTKFLAGGSTAPFDIDVYGQYLYCGTSRNVYQVDVSDGSVIRSISSSLSIDVLVNENGVYVSGGNYVIYLKAFDYDLNEIWTRNYYTNLFESGGWVVAHGNYIYVAGVSGDPFYSIPLDPVILKYDLQGNLLFDSTYANIHPPGNDFRRFITCDQSTGEIYMVAGPVKFSPSGEKLWQNNRYGHHAVYWNGILYVAENESSVSYHEGNKIHRYDAQTGTEIQ